VLASCEGDIESVLSTAASAAIIRAASEASVASLIQVLMLWVPQGILIFTLCDGVTKDSSSRVPAFALLVARLGLIDVHLLCVASTRF
jgi:hypothetical protein